MCSERGEAIEMLEDRLEDADAKMVQLEAKVADLHQVAVARAKNERGLIDALRVLEVEADRGLTLDYRLDPSLVLTAVNAALTGDTPPLPSLSREIEELRAENHNLLQELHEPGSPKGKAYQSVVTGLAADVEAARGERDHAFDGLESAAEEGWKFVRKLEGQKVEIVRLEAILERAMRFVRPYDCEESTCSSSICLVARAFIEECGEKARKPIAHGDSPEVPLGEVWFKNAKGEVLCKIINLRVEGVPEEKSG